MTARTRLIINCPHDASYRNRGLLRELYAARFEDVAFFVGPECATDPDFPTFVQTRELPRLPQDCLCGSTAYGPHAVTRHITHPRLAEMAEAVSDCDYVVFLEDDCLLSPEISGASIDKRWPGCDIIMPPIQPCPRSHTEWVWTQHSSGYLAFDRAAREGITARTRENWRRYSAGGNCHLGGDGLFYAFVDCVIFRAETLCDLAPTFWKMREVWHEAAIPTAAIEHTSRIGVLDGVALWGDARNRPLEELFSLLEGRDFVHPVKSGLYDSQRLLAAYQRSL